MSALCGLVKWGTKLGVVQARVIARYLLVVIRSNQAR